ncbi:MAG: hypothetical protein HQK75_07585 [Candidatus Magnetomorum sp.]|nr:hypothetical protein [Candidatus Magnetomorum sp.]
MKFRSVLLIIMIAVLSFFFLDIQKFVTVVYQYAVQAYKYATRVEPLESRQETSPIIQGKPCIIPGGTAYFYPNHHTSGYVVLTVQKVSENPSQALVVIEKIRTDKTFRYQNVKYYPDEKLWLPSERISCQSP